MPFKKGVTDHNFGIETKCCHSLVKAKCRNFALILCVRKREAEIENNNKFRIYGYKNTTTSEVGEISLPATKTFKDFCFGNNFLQ